MSNFMQSFLKCGFTGWCLEIVFTSLCSLRRRDLTLKGTTSIWMFPIYGCASLLKPLCSILKNKPVWVRGFTYMNCIFAAEYLSGTILKKRNLCPWDYAASRWNIGKVIRLDYAPFWFLTGLLFEKLILPNKTSSSKQTI